MGLGDFLKRRIKGQCIDCGISSRHTELYENIISDEIRVFDHEQGEYVYRVVTATVLLCETCMNDSLRRQNSW